MKTKDYWVVNGMLPNGDFDHGMMSDWIVNKV